MRKRRRIAGLIASAMFVLAIGGATTALAAVDSSITIHWNADKEQFRGSVSAGDAECIAHRTVRVFKKTADGRKLIGKTSTGSAGHWKLAVMIHSGHFFAVTPAQTIMTTDCGRARSKTIDVM